MINEVNQINKITPKQKDNISKDVVFLLCLIIVYLQEKQQVDRNLDICYSKINKLYGGFKLYKVEKYKYMSETNGNFIKNKIYYLRRTKDGIGQRLTSEKEELLISDGKLSLISDHNTHLLKENFVYDGYELYNNHKDYIMKTKEKP